MEHHKYLDELSLDFYKDQYLDLDESTSTLKSVTSVSRKAGKWTEDEVNKINNKNFKNKFMLFSLYRMIT